MLMLSLGLTSEIPSIHREEDATRPTLSNQPIDGRDRRESLARTRGHLDQCAGPPSFEAVFDVVNGSDLGGPHYAAVGRRSEAEPSLEGRS